MFLLLGPLKNLNYLVINDNRLARCGPKGTGIKPPLILVFFYKKILRALQITLKEDELAVSIKTGEILYGLLTQAKCFFNVIFARQFLFVFTSAFFSVSEQVYNVFYFNMDYSVFFQNLTDF